MTRPIPCKVTDCGWHSEGTANGAGPCADRTAADCLLALSCEDHPEDDECGHHLDARLAAYAGQTTEDEWRITGDPGEGYPRYVFTCTGPDAEAKARGFVRLAAGRWPVGPFLHRRTVTRTPWEEA